MIEGVRFMASDFVSCFLGKLWGEGREGKTCASIIFFRSLWLPPFAAIFTGESMFCKKTTGVGNSNNKLLGLRLSVCKVPSAWNRV